MAGTLSSFGQLLLSNIVPVPGACTSDALHPRAGQDYIYTVANTFDPTNVSGQCLVAQRSTTPIIALKNVNTGIAGETRNDAAVITNDSVAQSSQANTVSCMTGIPGGAKVVSSNGTTVTSTVPASPYTFITNTFIAPKMCNT